MKFFAVVLALGIAVPVQAQRQEWQNRVKIARDSILCTTSASLRQQRACRRLDSLVNTNPSSPGNVSYLGQVVYNSDSMYFSRPGVDTVTVCGVITDVSGVKRLAFPPVRIRGGASDSVAWGLRGGNPLSQMCARASMQVNATDSIPVTWRGEWFDYRGRRLFRPFFTVP